MKTRILTYFTPTGDGQWPEPGFYFENAEPCHIVEGLELLDHDELKLGRENGSLKKMIDWLVQSEDVDLPTAVNLREFLDYTVINMSLSDDEEEYPFGYNEVDERWGAEKKWLTLPLEERLAQLRKVSLISPARGKYINLNRKSRVLRFGGQLGIPEHSIHGQALAKLAAHGEVIEEECNDGDAVISQRLLDLMFAAADHYLAVP